MSLQNTCTKVIQTCFLKISTLSIVLNKYINCDVYFELMKLNFGHLELIQDVDIKSFKRAISKLSQNTECYSQISPILFFSESKKLRYYGRCDNKKYTVYYSYKPGCYPERTNTPWYADTSKLVIEMPRSWSTRANSQNLYISSDGQISNSNELTHPTMVANNESNYQSTNTIQPVSLLNDFTYWTSGKAISTFGYCNPKDAEQSARPMEGVVLERMIKLRAGYKSHDGWRHNVEYHDKNNKCTHFDIFLIQTKCKYVSIALGFALQLMHTDEFNWIKCCEMAIRKIDEIEGHDDEYKPIENVNAYRHTSSIVCARTIQRGHYEYRRNNESFVNITERREAIPRLPSIFDNNPDLHSSMIKYRKNNIENLSVELVCNWFHDEGIPTLIEERKKELEDVGESSDHIDKNTILEEHNLTKLCMNTVLGWMTSFGFKYSTKRKSYYVDGHENTENVEHRKKYIYEYIKDEIRTFRWIQITEEKAIELEEKHIGFRREDGYQYKSNENENISMYEFHIDTHKCLLSLIGADAEYGGYLSVRKNRNDKPLIIFGQDECIFKQYQMNTKRWVLPDGSSALLPKSDGQGIMYSSYVSRDFGYGFFMSKEDLEEVNKKRDSENYMDVEAAKEIYHGSIKKPKLTCSPFIRTFDYGKNKEGYWSFSHLVLQFEDIVDCLKHKFGSKYEFKFYFDNSAGHNKSRPNGLNSKSMNKYFGGTNNEPLHESEIKDETYLGEYEVPGKLKVGDFQSFEYKEGDIGPYYYSPSERLAKKYDATIENESVESFFNTKQLIQRINEGTSLNITTNMAYTKVKAIAIKEKIPLKYSHPKVIKGWMNKSKGMMQILYERGFINPNWSVKDCTQKGLKFPNGGYDTKLKYRKMVEDLPDFKGEQTRLEYFAEKLGVHIGYSPKYHPEIAGEGIEFCWALSKSWYRKQPLREKRKKNKFENLVQQSMDTKTVLDKDHVRSCARRARCYILAYFCVNENQNSLVLTNQAEADRPTNRTTSPTAQNNQIIESAHIRLTAIDNRTFSRTAPQNHPNTSTNSPIHPHTSTHPSNPHTVASPINPHTTTPSIHADPGASEETSFSISTVDRDYGAVLNNGTTQEVGVDDKYKACGSEDGATKSKEKSQTSKKRKQIEMSFQLVERFVDKYRKKFKSHRNILDQEKRLVGQEMKCENEELHINQCIATVNKHVINLT